MQQRPLLGFNTDFHTNQSTEHPYLEHMERLKLDVLTLVSEHVHHHLQVGLVGDIPGHNIEICPVKQDLSEELKRLSLGYIVLRQDEGGV